MTNDELSSVARALFNPLRRRRRRHRRAAALRLAHPAEQPGRRRGGDPVLDPRRAVVRLRRRDHRPQSRGRRSRHDRPARAAARAGRPAARASRPATACCRTSSSSTRARDAHADRRRLPEPRRHVAGAGRHGGPGRGRRARPGARLRRPLLRDGPGLGGDQRRRRGRRHGHARSAHLRASPAHIRRTAGRTGKPLDDRQRCGRLHRARSVPRPPAQLERACLEDVGDGEAARPDHGARRVLHVPHGHRARRRCGGSRRASSNAPRPRT